jgi:hypothetical protein
MNPSGVITTALPPPALRPRETRRFATDGAPLGDRDDGVRIGVERLFLRRDERQPGHASKLATGL